ncbi:MAG: aldo/keto reductase [Candidatus Dormiibacterota bacterium]
MVTRIGLGLAAVGRPAYINLNRRRDLAGSRSVAALRGRAEELLDDAYRLGIRYFDAARSYGRAEEFLAGWLRAREPLPEPVVCGSKWGYTYVGRWRMDAPVHEVKDHSLAQLRRQFAESRSLLGDHLNLYQIHSATRESGVLEDKSVLAELVALTRAGLAVGLSVSGPRQAEVVERALDATVDGVNPFTAVQATWNLLEPAAGPALRAAHSAGWAVLVKEAMANGRLVSGGDGGPPGPVGHLADLRGVGPDAVALAAVLAQEWVDVALSGAVTTGQLESNLRALEVQLSDGEREGLTAIAEPSALYWATRAALAWS